MNYAALIQSNSGAAMFDRQHALTHDIAVEVLDHFTDGVQ
jgi:hypothetical protein